MFLRSLNSVSICLFVNWKHYNKAYVHWVEELLAESLTSYVKQKDENTFIRRTNKRYGRPK